MISPRGGSPIGSSSQSPRLVLASESPRRLALLAQIGIVPDAIVPPHIDESIVKDELPRAHALRLALAKLRCVVLSQNGGSLVLAADTVVACGRRILPKATSADDVRRCLELLSGRRHQVFTAVAVGRGGGRTFHRTVMTRVAFDRISPESIGRYVACGEGLGKAGGYAIQGRAEAFVRSLNGSYSNVVGLPLSETAKLLVGCGYRISC